MRDLRSSRPFNFGAFAGIRNPSSLSLFLSFSLSRGMARLGLSETRFGFSDMATRK